MKKKIISSIITGSMVLAIIPTITFATERVYFGEDELQVEMAKEDHVEKNSFIPNQINEEISIKNVIEDISAIPMSINAASINGVTEYETLELALANVVEGDTITLFADAEISSALAVTTEITIDLNGFDIKQTGTDSVLYVDSDGDLTLEDSNTSRIRYGYWSDADTYTIVDDENLIPQDTDKTTLRGGIISGGTGTNLSGSYYGGGVYARGIFTMNGGTIAGNTVTSHGGGVYSGRDFTMTGGDILGNTAASNGGGIYVSYSSFVLESGNIKLNQADKGGGVYVSYSNVTMNGGAIDQNIAGTSGGGVYLSSARDYTYDRTFTMTDGTIAGNTAMESGGGVYVDTYDDIKTGNVKLEMSGGKIVGNQSEGNGGGVYLKTYAKNTNIKNSTLNMSNVAEISDNTAQISGGGVYGSGDYARVYINGNAVITNNTAINNGGGVYMASGKVELYNGTISDNTATSYGGGVYASDFTMDDGLIENNAVITAATAESGGGGVYANSFTMNGGTITNNESTTAGTSSATTYYTGGGGVCSRDFTMNGGNITYNTAGNYGGGVTAINFTMNDGDISYNEASSKANYGGGGGVYMYSGTFTLNDGNISNNEALPANGNGGGGVFLKESTFNMNDGNIAENETTFYGGGVYLHGTSTIRMFGGEILNNSALIGERISTNGSYSTIELKTPEMQQEASIKGYLYMDDDSYNMTCRGNVNITIDGGTPTTQSSGDVAYFKNTTWVFGKDDLPASDFKFTGPSNTIYDGSEKMATVESANILDGTVTINYTSSEPAYNSTTPPTEVGTYEVSVDVMDDSNYEDVSGLRDESWNFEITKATHSNETTTGSTKYGNEGSVDLSAWFGLRGASLTLDTVTDSSSIFITDVSISDEKLKFEFKDDETLVGETTTVSIVVSSANYKDFELTVTLEVLDKLSSNATVANFTKTYDGAAVTVEDLTKSADVDGTWSLGDDVTNVSESGIYTVIFTPTNTEDYVTDSVDVLITVNPKAISGSDFDLTSVVDKVYTGSEISPTVTSTLVANTDYTVTYSNNINVSTDKAKVTMTGQGNYSGSVEATFTITAKEITISDVQVLDREYDGATSVTILGTLNGVVAGDNVSYTATGTITDTKYGNAKDVSDIVFILTGEDANNYEIISQPSDNLGIKVDINQGSISDVTISGVNDSYIETGAAIIPTVVVKDKYGNILVEGIDYIIDITKNTNVGTAFVTIKGTGSGNYDSMEKVVTFEIVKDTSVTGDLSTDKDDDDLYTEGVEEGSAPDTGDDTHIATLVLLALLAMLGIVFNERKRKLRTE